MAEPTLEDVFAGATQTLETVTIPKDSLSTLAPKVTNSGDQITAGILATLQKFYVPERRSRDPDVSIVADPAIQIPDLYSADRPYHVFVLGFALFFESKIPELRADLLGLPGPRKLVVLARVRVAVLGSYRRFLAVGLLLRVRVAVGSVAPLREDSAVRAIARVQVGTVPALAVDARVSGRVRVGLGAVSPLLVALPVRSIAWVGLVSVPAWREDSALKAIAQVQVATAAPWLVVAPQRAIARVGVVAVAVWREDSALKAIARIGVGAVPVPVAPSTVRAIARIGVGAVPVWREDSALKAIAQFQVSAAAPWLVVLPVRAIARVGVVAAPMLREDSALKAIAQVRVSAAAPWLVVLPVRATGRLLVVRQFPPLAVLSVGARVSLSTLVSVPRRGDLAVFLRVQIRGFRG